MGHAFGVPVGGITGYTPTVPPAGGGGAGRPPRMVFKQGDVMSLPGLTKSRGVVEGIVFLGEGAEVAVEVTEPGEGLPVDLSGGVITVDDASVRVVSDSSTVNVDAIAVAVPGGSIVLTHEILDDRLPVPSVTLDDGGVLRLPGPDPTVEGVELVVDDAVQIVFPEDTKPTRTNEGIELPPGTCVRTIPRRVPSIERVEPSDGTPGANLRVVGAHLGRVKAAFLGDQAATFSRSGRDLLVQIPARNGPLQGLPRDVPLRLESPEGSTVGPSVRVHRSLALGTVEGDEPFTTGDVVRVVGSGLDTVRRVELRYGPAGGSLLRVAWYVERTTATVALDGAPGGQVEVVTDEVLHVTIPHGVAGNVRIRAHTDRQSVQSRAIRVVDGPILTDVRLEDRSVRPHAFHRYVILSGRRLLPMDRVLIGETELTLKRGTPIHFEARVPHGTPSGMLVVVAGGRATAWADPLKLKWPPRGVARRAGSSRPTTAATSRKASRSADRKRSSSASNVERRTKTRPRR